MASKPNLNKFSRLKRKVEFLLKDIQFLQLCKKGGVTPNFIKVTCVVNNSRTEKIINFAQKKWLSLEIKYLHEKLARTELELYSLHLKITKSLTLVETSMWDEFVNKILEQISNATKKKNETLKKKYLALREKNKKVERVEPKFVEDFICNYSDEVFNENEIKLLNKGLNFTPKPNKLPLLDAIVDIETILKFKTYSVQEDIRKEVKQCIDNITGVKNTRKNNNFQIIKSLKSKKCVYLKADKGNKLVILNKDDYENRMLKVIENNNYREIKRNPLPKMVKESNEVIKGISTVFGFRQKRKLLVSNPKVPLIYCLPKIHKTGDRPIVSSISSPCYLMAKWLVNEMRQLPPIKSLSVKNSFDFVEKIKEVVINNEEIMVSFDVVSLFPSIPVDIALSELEKYLDTVDIPNNKKEIYKNVAKLCMEQNFFQFRNKFYKVEKGTNMGNPLSPLISELFMSAFEIHLQNMGLLPRVWCRYVDDVFAIVKKDQVEEILNNLNNQFTSIKFTLEKEVEGKLCFLDLQLNKTMKNKIEVSVYHKPTSTLRFITKDSHCPNEQKKAAFHSLIHRLCKLPLSPKNYKSEYEYIKKVANMNGYSEILVDRLIFKHSNKIRKSKLSTLFLQNKNNSNQVEKKRVSMGFVPEISNKISKKFREHDMQLVFSNNNKLKNLLGSTKDKIDNMKKSGIYTIKCGDCDKIYYGQTKRTIEKRFKEHINYIRTNQHQKSAIATHVLEQNHFNVGLNNLTLKKQVTDDRKLDAYESYFIQNDRNSVNSDNGNINSILFSLV